MENIEGIFETNFVNQIEINDLVKQQYSHTQFEFIPLSESENNKNGSSDMNGENIFSSNSHKGKLINYYKEEIY